MATGAITLSAQIEGLRQLTDVFGRVFAPPQKAEIFAAALEKAIQPAFRRLYETTPVGPTGNLRAARDYKVVKYPSDGVAVAILGYRRAGSEATKSAAGGSVRVATTNDPDRGFHQWWLEHGTKIREIKTWSAKPYTRRAHSRTTPSGTVTEVDAHEVSGQNAYIASSYRRLGPFAFVKGSDPASVQTDPPYQRAFFKKSKDPIIIQPFPIGGYSGKPPLLTAWNDARPTVVEYLTRELRMSLEAAVAALAYSPTGSVK